MNLKIRICLVNTNVPLLPHNSTSVSDLLKLNGGRPPTAAPPTPLLVPSWGIWGKTCRVQGWESVCLSVSGAWIMYEWELWLMWQYRVSSQLFEGLCPCPNPNTPCCWLQRVWSGLVHMQTQTRTQTQTYVHIQSLHASTHWWKNTSARSFHICASRGRVWPSCAQTGTHRALCAGLPLHTCVCSSN